MCWQKKKTFILANHVKVSNSFLTNSIWEMVSFCHNFKNCIWTSKNATLSAVCCFFMTRIQNILQCTKFLVGEERGGSQKWCSHNKITKHWQKSNQMNMNTAAYNKLSTFHVVFLENKGTAYSFVVFSCFEIKLGLGLVFGVSCYVFILK